jgi:uncharacterized protein YjiS (DUF1127 family)
MKTVFKRLLEALTEAQKARARKIAFEQLDAHTLRDIGLEHEADRARRRALRERLQFSVY